MIFNSKGEALDSRVVSRVVIEIQRLRRRDGSGVVGVAIPSGLTQTGAILGALRSGAPVHILDHRAKEPELRRSLALSHPAIFLVDELRCPTEIKAASNLREVAVIQVPSGGKITVLARPPGNSGLPKQASLLVQTSGTTGEARLVVLGRQSLISAIRRVNAAYGLTEGDTCLNPMPLHHTHGLIAGLLAPICSGGDVILARDESSLGLAALTRKCTWLTASPPIYEALARLEPEATRDSSLRFMRTTSSRIQPRTAIQLETRLQIPLLQSYALSEYPGVACTHRLPPEDRKHTTVGAAFMTNVRVDPSTGDIEIYHVGRGPMGELDMTRSNPFTQSDQVVLRTGDIGRFVEGEGLELLGRAGRMINVGGEKVSPTEVEQVCLQYEGLRAVFAAGVPNVEHGEAVGVAIVPARQPFDMDDFRGFLVANLSSHQIPRIVAQVDSSAIDEFGKLNRNACKEALLATTNQSAGIDEAEICREMVGRLKAVLGRSDLGSRTPLISVADSLQLLGFLAWVSERYSITISIESAFSAKCTPGWISGLAREAAGWPSSTSGDSRAN